MTISVKVWNITAVLTQLLDRHLVNLPLRSLNFPEGIYHFLFIFNAWSHRNSTLSYDIYSLSFNFSPHSFNSLFLHYFFNMIGLQWESEAVQEQSLSSEGFCSFCIPSSLLWSIHLLCLAFLANISSSVLKHVSRQKHSILSIKMSKRQQAWLKEMCRQGLTEVQRSSPKWTDRIAFVQGLN